MFTPPIKNLFSFGRRDEGGYYLTIAGKSWIHSVEMEKFFLPFHRLGFPVVLHDALAILTNFRGTGKIGIIPDGIIPRYCESCCPEDPNSDFMNLPCEKLDREALPPHVHWHPLPPLRLKLSHDSPRQ